MDKTGLLEGKKAITDFLETTEYMLKKYVSMGMPVVIEDGRWMAHKDNIEDFFRAYTRRKHEGEIKE